MPIGRLRNQDITYWTIGGLNGEGHSSYNTPVSVKGRWEDRSVLVDSGTQQEKLSSNARVYLNVTLSVGDYVYEGVSVSATPEATAKRVIRVVKIPSVDGRTSERAYYLD